MREKYLLFAIKTIEKEEFLSSNVLVLYIKLRTLCLLSSRIVRSMFIHGSSLHFMQVLNVVDFVIYIF